MRLTYDHIAQVLAVLEDHDTPPTINLLTDSWGGSRLTVRRALARAEGMLLVNRLSGTGRFDTFQITGKGRAWVAKWHRRTAPGPWFGDDEKKPDPLSREPGQARRLLGERKVQLPVKLVSGAVAPKGTMAGAASLPTRYPSGL